MRMESMVVVWEGAGFDYSGVGGLEGRSSAKEVRSVGGMAGLQCFVSCHSAG